ncbi:response regulator [Pedobacter sp. UC225_65]|uniref:response regulator n=1 Tax=Pedobacter sp. UC225_65 TaxID=3350173 RepID=UPI003672E726
MNILIADNLGIYRFGLKAIIYDVWTDALVDEVSNFDEMMESIFEKNFDLLVIDTEMQGNEKLESFICQAVNYTRIIIVSEHQHTNTRVKHLLNIGADALLSKSTSMAEVINTLQLIQPI